jgi:hypothetical protein
VRLLAGPPVDLSAFQGLPLTTQTQRAATAKIMADVTGLLAQLRGEIPPADPYHPAVARRKLRQEQRTRLENPDNAGTTPAAGSGTAEARPS